MPSPDLIVPLPVNRFPNKLIPDVPNNILKNPPFYFFALFLYFLLRFFINKSDSLRYLTIFMKSFIISFEIINAIVQQAKSEGRPDPNILLWIVESAADAAPVNSNGIKTLLAML